MEKEDEEGNGLGGPRCGDGGESSRSKASTSFSQCYRRNRESHFSVSALFKSISGPDRERPENNGLRNNISHSSAFVRTSSRLQRFSHSKKNSLQYLGMLMSRMNGHIPDQHVETPADQQCTYSISDQVPQTSWHGPPDAVESKGLGPPETEQNTSQRANGRDSLVLWLPSHLLPPQHCASSLTASSAQLLASSDVLCHGWVGPVTIWAPPAGNMSRLRHSCRGEVSSLT